MNISSGEYKGVKLLYPKNQSFRPTKQIVREALFDIIESRHITKGDFLDLFAGSGAVGLEALSRGFRSVTLIDKDITYLKKNINNLPAKANAIAVYRQTALKALEIFNKRNQKFSVIFIDPPYESTLITDSLNKLYHFDILEPDALIIIETDTEKVIPLENYTLEKEYNYGITTLKLLRKG